MSDLSTDAASALFQRVRRDLVLYPQHLAVADPQGYRMLRERWSPSSSKSFALCPARWAADRALSPLSAPDAFDAAPLGTAAHRVLEVFYGLPVAQRTADRVRSIVDALHDDSDSQVVPPLQSMLSQWRAAVLDRVVPLFGAEDPRQVLIAALEMPLTTSSIDGVPFAGVVDRKTLLTAPDGSITGVSVDDYKSAVKGAATPWKRQKYGDDHGDQLLLYALAIQDLDGRIPDQVRVLYTATGQVYIPQITDAALSRVRSDFARSFSAHLDAAESGVYPLRPSPLCRWCPLASVCPGSESIGKNDPDGETGFLGERVGICRAEPRTVVTGLPERNTMSDTTQPRIVEDKSWIEASPDSRLNGNSYAAMAAFGTVALAVRYLTDHDQQVTKTTVTALSHTFASIVASVQVEFSGKDSTMDGLSTRLRGALNTAIETLPAAPFGGSGDAWAEWVNSVTRRVHAQAMVALDLWATGPASQPWAALAAS